MKHDKPHDRGSQLWQADSHDEMNFKRPCWLALFISLGMMLVGYCSFITSEWSGKRETWWTVLTGLGGYILTILGAFGVVVSLIWLIVAAILSGAHLRRPKN